MPDFAVSTTFTGKDRVSQSFRKMGRSAGMFGDKASKAFRRASREGSRFGDITKGILTAGAVQRGLGLVQQGISGVVMQFVEFDDAVTAAAVRFKDIGPDAVDFAAQLDKVKASARDAGQTTEFTAAQAAQALDFLARAGFSSAEAFGSLGSMINLATSSGEDFAQVADFSSDLLGAFGLAVKDTSQKIANLNSLNDVLTRTANTANVTVEDMFETMKVAAPIATKYGASLEEVAALTAVMGSAGIKGSQGATALKNMFTRLSAPTKEVTDGLAKLGMTQQDLVDVKTGKLRDMTSVLGDIGNRLKDVAQPEQLGILKDLFGAFALAGGANLVTAIENVEEFTTSLRAAEGTAQKTADIMRMSLGNRIKSLGSAATEMGFKFLSAFDRNGKDAITRLTDAIRRVDMQPMIDVTKTAITTFKGLLRVAKEYSPVLAGMAAGFVVYSGALKAVAIATAIQGFIQFITVLRGTAGAMGALNAVIAANPVGAVIVAVSLLAAGLVFMATKFPPVKSAMFNVFNAFRPFYDLLLLVVDHLSGPFGAEFDRAGGTVRTFATITEIAFNAIAASITAILTPFRAVVKILETLKEFGVKGTIDIIRGKTPEAAELRSQLLQDIVLPGVASGAALPEPQTRKESEVTPPNRVEAEARRQQIGFKGRLEIAGAPEGSTIESTTTGAPPIDVAMLGANP